jgi:DNA-binding NarL/FixJ family response regulator
VGSRIATDDAVTVLAVDDQDIFRRALRELIAATPGFEQVGEAASGLTAIELVEQRRPDLMLLDVRMPGMDGVETARRIAALDASPVVILISVEALEDLPSSVAAAPHIRKQKLSPRSLRALWATYGRSRA